VHPTAVPAVFTLLGGPECQPFSKASKQRGFEDARSNTLLWFFWCLSVRQFPTAFIENSAQLQRSNKGRDWVGLQGVGGGHRLPDFGAEGLRIELEVCGGATESVHLADSG
jgi:hypothetical protein